MSPEGVHYIVEVSGCDDTITNVAKLQDILVEAANRAHAQVWSVSFNRFPPSKALKGCCGVKNLILHSDQGSPYTSRVFCEYCERAGIIQSMSQAGCPYDNAPMERYFNTLKTEHINLHEYEDKDSLYRAVEEFAYVHYNHVRPHTYNNQRTPFEAR